MQLLKILRNQKLVLFDLSVRKKEKKKCSGDVCTLAHRYQPNPASTRQTHGWLAAD